MSHQLCVTSWTLLITRYNQKARSFQKCYIKYFLVKWSSLLELRVKIYFRLRPTLPREVWAVFSHRLERLKIGNFSNQSQTFQSLWFRIDLEGVNTNHSNFGTIFPQNLNSRMIFFLNWKYPESFRTCHLRLRRRHHLQLRCYRLTLT